MLSRIAVSNARPVYALQPSRFIKTSASRASEEGQERDLVNFPRPVRAVEPGKVRLGFIPEEWFTFFYNKTGVTGPYAFGIGLATTLCSKEIYIMEHEFYAGLSLGIMAVYAIKKLGPSIASYLDSEVEKADAALSQSRTESLAAAQEAIANEKVEQERAQAMTMLFDAKRENVALQLEAAYREQLMTVYNDTKRRLDYQVEVQAVERRMEQKQMVDWVIRNVKEAVTVEQEKEALSQCIANLKNLAQQNTARI